MAEIMKEARRGKKHGVRSGNTLRSCFRCKDCAIMILNEIIDEKFTCPMDSEEKKVQKYPCYMMKDLKSKGQNTARKCRGDPFRGRNRFVTCDKIHRNGSMTCCGSGYKPDRPHRVHVKEEYTHLKNVSAKEALERSHIEINTKRCSLQKHLYY